MSQPVEVVIFAAHHGNLIPLLFLLLLLSLSFSRPPQDEPHAFWDTQPVPKIGTEVTDVGPLVEQTVDEIRKEPYPMAPGMEVLIYYAFFVFLFPCL